MFILLSLILANRCWRREDWRLFLYFIPGVNSSNENYFQIEPKIIMLNDYLEVRIKSQPVMSQVQLIKVSPR